MGKQKGKRKLRERKLREKAQRYLQEMQMSPRARLKHLARQVGGTVSLPPRDED